MLWRKRIADIDRLLNHISFINRQGNEYSADDGFGLWKETALVLKLETLTIYFIGNGASASMASHFAADLAKNAHLHTQVFSDLSLITAISNDMGYHMVFAEPLRRRAHNGDMLVAISSSGQSKNILLACETARKRGLTVVTLSAMSPDNPLRTMGDLNIYVPAKTYGLAETCHSVILHHWMDMIEIKKTNKKNIRGKPKQN